jgi:transcriptional regulator with XRE-family HTH domain
MSGKILREKIKLCGISLREVATLLGISEQNLQKKLNVDDVKVSFLVDLSRKLNKDINYFLDIPHSSQKNSSVNGSNNLVIQGNENSSIDNRHYYSDSPDVLRAQVEEKDRLLKEKEERIKEKDAQIKEKDAQINKLLNILQKAPI